MKRHYSTKILSLLLTSSLACASPVSVQAQKYVSRSQTPQRLFIVSQTDPSGTDLAGKVSLVGAEFQAKNICDSMQIVYGETSDAQEGDIIVQISDALDENSYEIAVTDGILTVTAGSPISVMYGLRNILKSCMIGQSVTETSETPDVDLRIFHLDCGRKYFTKDWIISLIRELSWLQMNQLELDFSNGTGFRFALDDMSLDIDGDGITDEDLSVLPGGTTDPDSWLTQDEMDEIIAAAQQYGVEIVPCLDTPGHTGWILGKEAFTKYAENGEVNVTDENSIAFIKALVKKYAAYFAEKGCTTFHIGGDEYLHAYYNWGTPMSSTEDKYGAVADYLDGLAKELKEMGYEHVRSFNDPLYYNENTSEHTYEYIDQAEYWCRSMSGFNYASPATLANQGLSMINGHGDFYDIMTGGDHNWKEPVGSASVWKTPAGIYANFQNNTFPGNIQIADEHVIGATYFLWCDDPTQGTQQQVAASLYPRLRSASAKMEDESASGTYADFALTFTDSAGGFTADGTLQEMVLPEMEAPKSAYLVSVISLLEKLEAITESAAADNKADIEAANTAYNSLTPEQKLLIDTKLTEKLTALTKSLDDICALENVVAKLKKLGLVKDAAAAKAEIESVRAAYNALTPQQRAQIQKALVSNLTSLEGALKNLELQKIPAPSQPSPSPSPVSTIKNGSEWPVGNLVYKVSDVSGKTVTAVKMNGKKTAVSIPASVKILGISFQVTQIGTKAFAGNKNLKKVTIGKNVQKIGKKAFYNCKKLRYIKIKSQKLNAKNVGARAFAKTSPKAVVRVPKAKKTAYRGFLYRKGLSKRASVK